MRNIGLLGIVLFVAACALAAGSATVRPHSASESCCGDATAAKCTGADNCTACKNCKSCAYCVKGRTCGVCKPKKKDGASR